MILSPSMEMESPHETLIRNSWAVEVSGPIHQTEEVKIGLKSVLQPRACGRAGQGKVLPTLVKVNKILYFSITKTKEEVCAFLGIC